MRTLRTQINAYRRIQSTLAVLLAVALIATYVAVYRPLRRQLDQTESAMARQRSELVRNQARAANLPRLEASVKDLQAKVERNGHKLPSEPQIGPFMRDVAQVSQQSALRNFAVLTMAPKKADLFTEMPICMSFQGDFVNTALFLRQVEDLLRLTRVQRLKIETSDERQGQVDVEVTMNIYCSEG